MKHLLLLILLYGQVTSAQRLKKSDKKIIENLRSEIGFLASDRLEGRRTGTPGEKLAYEYLAEQFKGLGLLPKGDNNTYIQAFEINEGKEVLPSSHLSIDGRDLVIHQDYFPFAFSAPGAIKANVSPVLLEKGSPWFLDIKDMMDNNKNNPHFDMEDAIQKKAIGFAKKGATSLFVYNTNEQDNDLLFDGKDKTEPLSVPVIFITNAAAKKYLEDATGDLTIDLTVAIGDKIKTGHNVAGYMDNGAANTIIIGAHYDHLGYGEDHNSLWTGAPAIHNGADDNASGTAAVIELARMFVNSKLKKNNYLFICFSGEELGLFGSKYFTEHPTINLGAANYMINSDMVGRLNDTTHKLIVGGYGTSPAWGKVLDERTKALEIKFDSSGIGPSDHTSFYLKNIPVLFFFTGINKDYHKPTDDVEKINFTGELYVIKYIYHIIEETNNLGKIAFSKTREPNMGGSRFTVSLGIMPDYTFSGKGVRADAIVDGKIAQKVGIQAGDIIVKLGEYNFSDLNSYMNVLSKFKKGDATKVTVLRGNVPVTFDIVF
ncbi:MAG: M28 family peptidase [Bacteroidota bacterium]|nr:M28 family peptidase [Bacteroidota bacterium]